MTTSLFLKVILVWLAIVILAIGNGALREIILVPLIGQIAALPISGIILSFIVFFGKRTFLTYFFIGLEWVLLTLLFEFVFGHYIIGKSWNTLFKMFDIIQGNLFIIVLLTCLISPLIVEKLKRYCDNNFNKSFKQKY